MPDELLPADRLGHVHFVGIGGAGLSAIARIMLARGIAGQRQRRRRLADPRRAAGPGRTGARRPRRRPARRRGHRRRVDGGAGGQPGVRRGARARPAGAAALGGPRLGDGRPPGGRRGRHPRQDHDHRAAHRGARRRPARTRRTPSVPTSPRPAATPAEGTGDLFVAEADESDGAFLHYAPYAAIVTNIEADHLDHWETEEAYAQAFDDFAATVDPAGFLVCCVDDAGAAALAARQRAAGLRVVTVSTRPGVADVGPGGAGRRHALVARRPLPRRRAAGARRRAHPRLRRRRAGRGHRVVHRDPAADGAQGRGRRRPRLRQLRAPPDRDRRRPRGRPRAGRRRPAGRRLPAAPGLAHPDVRHRDGRGAGRGRRGRGLRRLPGPRGPPTPR